MRIDRIDERRMMNEIGAQPIKGTSAAPTFASIASSPERGQLEIYDSLFTLCVCVFVRRVEYEKEGIAS